MRHPSQYKGQLPFLSRRGWLRLFLFGGFMSLIWGQQAAQAQGAEKGADGAATRRPEKALPQAFMERAEEMRRRAVKSGDQGYGAVVAMGNRIVGEAPSRVVLRKDPTAHAEMEAIRDAARRLGRRDLSGATLYSSSQPCPMCEAAAYWAGISRLMYTRSLTDGGAPRLCG